MNVKRKRKSAGNVPPKAMCWECRSWRSEKPKANLVGQCTKDWWQEIHSDVQRAGVACSEFEQRG
jgi:hypothetical protein